MKIEIDGNDGTGKSYRALLLKRIIPGLQIKDRGLFSAATLNEKLFDGDAELIEAFRATVKENTDTLYIICTCSIEKSQNRILERGDSLDEEYHTERDLKKFNDRFDFLLHLVKECPNVIRVNTENDL